MLETERLLIRPFELEDLEAIHEQVWADPRVAVPFAGATRPIDETRQWLENYIREIRHGHIAEYFAIMRKDDRQIIGLFTLSVDIAHWLRLECDPETPFNRLEVELGYAIGSRYQHQGYAMEAGACMIERAFTELKLARLISGNDEQVNPASYHLAKKLGFRMVRNLHTKWPGMVGVMDNPR